MRVGYMLICQFVRSSSSHHRPWQIALAVTVGLLLGIVPKSTALFVAFSLLCFLLPAHLPILVLCAVATWSAAPLLETPLAHLGLWSLTHPSLAPYWLKLDSLPLIPWLGVHNSVVHGSLLLWSCMSVPAFASCFALSRAFFGEDIINEAAQIADSVQLNHKLATTTVQTTEQVLKPISGPLHPGAVDSTIAPPKVIWDDIDYSVTDDRAPHTFELAFEGRSDTVPKAFAFEPEDSVDEEHCAAPTTDEIAERAANLAAWAEELINEELLADARTNEHSSPLDTTSIPNAGTEIEANADDDERWLIETTMEVVRFAERAVTQQAALKAKQFESVTEATESTQASDFETQADGTRERDLPLSSSELPNQVALGREAKPVAEGEENSSTIRREQSAHADHGIHLDVSRPVTAVSGNRPREEALHYLLRHLKGVQEKAQQQ